MNRYSNYRRKSAWKLVISAVIKSILETLIAGWMLMLAVTVAHEEWIHQLPTIGFWWAVLLVMLLRGAFHRSPSSSEKEG